MDIFTRTRNKREEDAGLKEKPKQEPKKESGKTMSRDEFLYGRPSQSKKWTEK